MTTYEWIPLQAGPVSLFYTNGELRYLRIGAREMLRRVYVAVRDRWWTTVPVHITNLQAHIASTHFHLTFTGRHQQDEIDFAWEGVIRGEAEGTITFTVDGRAVSSFWRNRIGLCVLHPVRECAGQACLIEHTDGTFTQGNFPSYISPHQPFKDLRAITYETAPGLRTEIRLEGDTFEMEDQRNWADGSFKIYSTPLALPFPVMAEAGMSVRQSLTLRLQGKAHVVAKHVPAMLTVGEKAISKLPQLGLGMAGHEEPLCETRIQYLRALNLTHIRVDLPMREGWPAELARAINVATALHTKLEIALFLSNDAAKELVALRTALNESQPQVARWLIFHETESVTNARWIELARGVLGDYDRAVPFGAGTNQYFAELNRQLLSAADNPSQTLQQPYPADLLCYSINPQVHGSDEATMTEALEAQADTVLTARYLTRNMPIAVTPITLKPRFNPHCPRPINGLLESIDMRQASMFAAGWTLGSLKYLSESGVTSLTFYETTGSRGVVDSLGRQHVFDKPAEPYPIYYLFASLCDWAGAEVLPVESGDPLNIFGFALRKDGKETIWVANLSNVVQTIRLDWSNKAQRAWTLTTSGWQSMCEGQATSEVFELTLQPNEVIWLS